MEIIYTRRTVRGRKFQSVSPTFRGRDAKSKIAARAFLFCVVCMQSALAQRNYTFVKTKYGEVRGEVFNFYVSDEVPNAQRAAYLGIPYAKPPVEELRFLKPQPPDPWNTTLEADKMPPACVQHLEYPFPWYDSERGQSEDCLYLNIWAPFKSQYKRTVRLYIHGGGFSSGSNRMGYYGGLDDALDYLPDSNYQYQSFRFYMGFVDVVINYRLGAFGFLTSGTDDAPGNAGLYDMVMAMNWVKENIEAFGGDPNDIVLIGQGAGGIAASLFTVSPLTSGLFSQVVMSSGNFMTMRKNKFEDNLKLSQRLASAVGCSRMTSLQEEPKKIVQCMRNVRASRLAKKLSSFNKTSHYFFYPQYEQDDLIPSDPRTLLEDTRGNTKILIAYTTDEGSYLLTTLRPDVFGVFGKKDVPLNGTFARAILTEYLKVKEYPDPESIADRLLNGTDTEPTNRNRELVYKAMGDESVVCPIVYFAEKFGKQAGSTRLEEIKQSFEPAYNPWAKWMGTVHFNNVQVQFYSTSDRLRVNGKSYDVPFVQKGISFYTRGHYSTDFDTQTGGVIKFTNTTREYTFQNQTKDDVFKEKRSNPSKYNCEVFRPYH